MVVNLNGVEEGQAKNIQALEKIYQKSITKSMAAKSITDFTPSQMKEKQNIVYLDLMHNRKIDYEDNFNPTFKTTNFANNTADFVQIRKPALKKALFKDKINMTMNRLDKVYHTQYTKNNNNQQRNFNKNKTNVFRESIDSSSSNSDITFQSKKKINDKENINDIHYDNKNDNHNDNNDNDENNDENNKLVSIQENINIEETKSKIKNSVENIHKKKTSITIQTNALIERLGLMNKQFKTDRFCETQRIQ